MVAEVVEQREEGRIERGGVGMHGTEEKEKDENRLN